MNNDNKYERYLKLLLDYNSHTNLTAIREENEIKIRHFEDSLKLLEFVSFENKNVLDIGSGAGFPGLPIAIETPNSKVTLLDSTNKKVVFLQYVINALDITNAICIHGRAEELAHSKMRESFDIVTARGVAALGMLYELCLPFLKVGGLFLAMKSNSDEIGNPAVFGGIKKNDIHYKLSNGVENTVIIVEKTKMTSDIYPRTWNKIKSKPIVYS